jgi:hypothetical protein
MTDLVAHLYLFTGEVISDTEEGGEEAFDDEDDYMKKQMAKLDSDKQAILNNKTLIAEVCQKFKKFSL